MFEIKKVISLTDNLKKTNHMRFIFTPRSGLPTRTNLKKLGERKYTIEYNPKLCDTNDVAYELFRAVQLSDPNWVNVTPISIITSNTHATVLAEKLQTLLFDFWVKKMMRKKGFRYGGYVKDYFTILLDQMIRDFYPYQEIKERRYNLACSTLDYALYLFNKSMFSKKFNKQFEDLFKKYDSKAVEIANAIKISFSKNECETPNGVEKILIEICEILNLRGDITSLRQ
ncbi:hypothetical protein [[Eubacterium] cellulosolvens]